MSEEVSRKVYSSNLQRKFEKFSEYEEENKYSNWYLGLSQILIPLAGGSGKKFRMTYKLNTTSLRGTIKTPLFKETFDKNSFVPKAIRQISIEFKLSDNNVNQV